MEDVKNKISDLASHIEDLAETYYRLSLLNVTQRAANVASASITAILVFLATMFVLLLGGVALSLWLGDLVNSRAGGFLLGAAFFLLVMIILVLLRKKIIFPFFRDLIIRKFYD
jgi:hypothetical protein